MILRTFYCLVTLSYCIWVLDCVRLRYVIAIELTSSHGSSSSISLDSSTILGLRAQRDIDANIAIDQLSLVGVELSSVLFHDHFFASHSNKTSTDLLSYYPKILDSGVQSLIVDIELKNNIWNIKDTSISFESFLQHTKTYLDETNTNLEANILFMMLRVQNGNYTYIDYNSSTQNISALFDSQIGSSYIYKPDDLSSDRSKGKAWNVNGDSSNNGWPTLSRFLYDTKKRLIISDISNVINTAFSPYTFNRTILHLDEFNATLGIPSDISEVREMSSISWRFLLANFTKSDAPEYVTNGYSPILANQYNASTIKNLPSDILPLTLWSWQAGEPRKISKLEKKTNNVAYNCGMLKYMAKNESAAWAVGNCYSKMHGLCQSDNDTFIFILSEDDDTYFAFDSYEGTNCPEGYQFSVPYTPLHQRAVELTLSEYNFSDAAIWIDINSIQVSDCWVTGGPYATCPYEKVMSRRNFTKMLTPACICSFELLLIVSLLNLLSAPIHDNRNNWNRVVSKLANTEVDGVPA